MIKNNNSTTIEVDIHGMDTKQAKKKLERLIVDAKNNVKEIVVIHGFNSGNALQNMVRKSLKSDRIERKILSLNSGQTIIILKDKEM